MLHGFLLALVLTPRPALAQELYVRAGGGWDDSRPTVLQDRACDVAPLLNLFGCGAGEDGRSLGARGSFGEAVAIGGAVGVRVAPALRLEAEVSHRAGFAFAGQANFRRAGADQPVEAEVEHTAVIGRVALDIGIVDPIGPFVPFVSGGVGASRNGIGQVAFEFPRLSPQPATTAAEGGVGWSLAWDVGAGGSLALADRWFVEAAYRYSDFGRVRSDDGAIDVVRGTFTNTIQDIGGLSARLRSHGVVVGLRRRL